jgi:hypothetical protein
MNYIYTLAALFFLLAFLLPNHYLPWLSVYQDLSIFFASFLMMLGMVNLKEIKIPHLAVLIFFISLVPLAYYLCGISYYLSEAIMYFLYLLVFSVLIIIGFNLNSNPKRENIISGFLIIIIVASIVSVYIQLKQWLLLSGSIWIVDLRPGGRPFANMGQPNQLCTLLLMGLMSLLYLYENKKINRLTISLLSLYLLIGVVLTQSRTAWVFALCFIVWWFVKTHKVKMRSSTWHIFSFYIVFIVLWVGLPILSDLIGVNTLSTLEDRSSSGMHRLEMWRQIVHILMNSPWYGYGWGQLNPAQLLNNTDYIAYPVFGYSHNLFLDLLIWNGLILGSFFIFLILYFFVKLSLAVNKNNFLLLSLLGPVAVHSMFEYPFAYAYFFLPFGFVLGGVYAQYYSEKNIQINRNIYYGAIFIFLSGLIAFLFDYKKIYDEYQLMRYENVQLESVKENRIELNSIFLNHISEYMWFTRYPISSTVSDSDLERMRMLVYRFPDRPILYKYIEILLMNQKEGEAKKILKIYNAFHQENITISYIQSLKRGK